MANNEITSDVKEEVQRHFEIAYRALLDDDYVSADRHATEANRLQGRDSSVYIRLARRFGGDHPNTLRRLHNLENIFSQGYGGYCSGGSGVGESNSRNPKFAAAFREEAQRCYEIMIMQRPWLRDISLD